MDAIDSTDRRILRLLQEDGRISTVDLADKVGLSPTATGERVKRLIRDGFVTGFRAMLDPRRVGKRPFARSLVGCGDPLDGGFVGACG